MPLTHDIPLDQAGATVAEVMLRDAGAHAADAPRAAAEEELANPKRKLVLVAEDGRFVGAIDRETLAAAPASAATLGEIARRGAPTVRPGDAPRDALALAERHGTDRIPVVGEDGTLEGLVCWDGRRECFCADHPDPGRRRP